MSRKIATLWDNKGSNDNDNEYPEGEGQAFYAGGSEHSGQQILGPSRDGPGSNRLIEDLFSHARHSANRVDNQPNSSSSGNIVSMPITFWRNGFSVGEEGELRDYASPDNRQFLDDLKRGDTPRELTTKVRGRIIDVSLVNKANQDYVPKRTFQAFSGEGHRLGAPTPP